MREGTIDPSQMGETTWWTPLPCTPITAALTPGARGRPRRAALQTPPGCHTAHHAQPDTRTTEFGPPVGPLTMDPNETLERLRGPAERADSQQLTLEEGFEALEPFGGLDLWLSRGGFLPGAWTRS